VNGDSTDFHLKPMSLVLNTEYKTKGT